MPINEKLLEKMNAGREYRSIDIKGMELRSNDKDEMVVEGYATTFMEPYLLYAWEDYEVWEQVDREAFKNCDMTDVVFQYNHGGRVPARTRNKTLELWTDEHGLGQRAKLGGTELGRQLFEEIKGGYIDRMSMGFVVGKDKQETTEDHETGKTTVLRTILEISKLYDVSAVSFPANEDTEISARSYGEGVIAEAKEQERLAAEDMEKRRKMQEEIRELLGSTKEDR